MALGALLALAFCAASASADPLSMTFTEDRANVGVQLTDAAMFAAPATAPFKAQIDPGSGSITSGVLDVPQFATHITEPINADVTVDFAIGAISGSFTQATGSLTLEGTAGGTLTSEGEECTVSTDPPVLALSTAGNSGGESPRSGAAFTAGLTGPGAIAGQWDDMLATPVDSGDAENVSFCKNVHKRIGGPGGIWLDQKGEVVPLPIVDPRPSEVCVVPKVTGRKAKAARRMIRAAGCKVGKVSRPKRMKVKGSSLVVKRQTPGAGATPVNGKVHLKLGLEPQKARH